MCVAQSHTTRIRCASIEATPQQLDAHLTRLSNTELSIPKLARSGNFSAGNGKATVQTAHPSSIQSISSNCEAQILQNFSSGPLSSFATAFHVTLIFQRSVFAGKI